MAIMGKDRFLRLFHFATGKLMWKIDETLQYNMLKQTITKSESTPEDALLKMEQSAFQRKVAIEKDVLKA